METGNNLIHQLFNKVYKLKIQSNLYSNIQLIQIGDGLIPQIERFASKYSANKITINTFHTIISTMVEKADNPTGNVFMFVINEPMWGIVQRVLGDYLANRKTDEAYVWSKGGEGKYIKVGATFDAYEWGFSALAA